MTPTIKILNKNEHKDLRFIPQDNFSSLNKLQLLPITSSEMRLFCCRFPIVVAELDGRLNMAILTSLDGTHNIAIDEEGHFQGNYIPAFLRRYPFILLEDKKEEKLLIGLDESSECFKDKNGEKLYDDEGNTTKLVNDIAKFLGDYEKDMQRTANVLQKFKELDILDSSTIVVPEGEEKKTIGGFSIINKEKLLEQKEEVLVDTMKKNWSELIELHHLSLVNLPSLKV